MSLTVIQRPPQIVIPAAAASVVTTTLQVETTQAPDARVPKSIKSKFYHHPRQHVNLQTKNPYVGAATSAGTSIVSSNVSMGSLPAAQFSSTPFKDSLIVPTNGSNNVMPNGSTMLAHPPGTLCLGNQQPCYTGTSTTGNQPLSAWRPSLSLRSSSILVGVTGQKLYEFSMGTTNSVSNHSSIYYKPLSEKAFTSDGHQVSPGFTVSH
tara:strand:+ start:1490 stop:2113 length:624 start_codon:yes stop_codon:yes gene_type:complete